MVVCNTCGNELNNESLFCNKCGNKVGETNEEIAVATALTSIPKKKSRGILFISLGIIVLIVLAAGGWFYYGYSQKQEAKRIEENAKAIALKEKQEYQDKMIDILSSINLVHFSRLDEPVNDIYKPIIMMDTIDSANKSIKTISDLATDANSKIISLQDIIVPKEFVEQHKNFIVSLNNYKSSLEAKSGFIEQNKVDIVSSIKLFLKGNIFSVDKEKEMSGKLDKLSNDIKSSANDLKQRSQNLRSKFS